MAVKCLSTSLKLFESRRELERRKARRQKWRRGDWRRQERGTAVGMAGGRGGACISRCRKSGRKRGFPPSTGFPPRRRRPLLAISGIYTRLHAHIFRFLLLRPWTWTYKLASLRLPLLWPLYTCREKLRYENRCHVCYLWHREAVCFFEKRELSFLHLFYRKKFL